MNEKNQIRSYSAARLIRTDPNRRLGHEKNHLVSVPAILILSPLAAKSRRARYLARMIAFLMTVQRRGVEFAIGGFPTTQEMAGGFHERAIQFSSRTMSEHMNELGYDMTPRQIGGLIAQLPAGKLYYDVGYSDLVTQDYPQAMTPYLMSVELVYDKDSATYEAQFEMVTNADHITDHAVKERVEEEATKYAIGHTWRTAHWEGVRRWSGRTLADREGL